MADHSSDLAVSVSAVTADDPRPRIRAAARTDWRLGGRTVKRWREPLLAVAFGVLAVALLTAAILQWLRPESEVLATAIILIAMAGVCVWAFVRSRPAGLLRFRSVDLVYGLGAALLLRLVQGWIDVGLTGYASFPTHPVMGERPRVEAWMLGGLDVLVEPVVEEFFFRGVILVAVFTLLRRRFGPVAAAAAALLVSAASVALVHLVVPTTEPGGPWAVAALGIVCGLSVLLTGRIWAAVLAHVGFGALGTVLTFVGSAWG
ncbi:CPBP family glutamic-type intramembrane protease [Microbacterium sp. NPDC055357]